MKNMNHIKTYESFLSNIFGKKNDSKTKNKKGGFLKSLNSLFSKENDELAEKVYNSLKTALESQSADDDDDNKKSEDPKESKLMGEIARYGDYKRSVKFKAKGTMYVVTVQKSSSKRRTTSKMFFTPGETYVLVINNRHFIDRKTGSPTVSQKIAKNIWNLLDKAHDKKWFNKEDMEKDFE